MKTLEIECPEGYEIDKENSTFEKIVFKEIVFKEINKLPMSWEELNIINGYYVSSDASVFNSVKAKADYPNRNAFPSKEEAEAMLALAQLCQLRDAWNKGWKPNYKDGNQVKFVLITVCEKVRPDACWKVNCIMCFKTKELRDNFLIAFRDLLEIAKPFL
jgi:hypothetical protein